MARELLRIVASAGMFGVSMLCFAVGARAWDQPMTNAIEFLMTFGLSLTAWSVGLAAVIVASMCLSEGDPK